MTYQASDFAPYFDHSFAAKIFTLCNDIADAVNDHLPEPSGHDPDGEEDYDLHDPYDTASRVADDLTPIYTDDVYAVHLPIYMAVGQHDLVDVADNVVETMRADIYLHIESAILSATT
jgi:hypothetical protein